MKTKSILILAALTVSLAACNKSKSTEAVPAEVVSVGEIEAVPEPETPAVDPAVALKEFKAFAKSYGEAFNNITKNPSNYSKLAGQVQSKVAEMEAVKAQFTPAQLKEFDKALKIIKDVNSGGTKKKK